MAEDLGESIGLFGGNAKKGYVPPNNVATDDPQEATSRHVNDPGRSAPTQSVAAETLLMAGVVVGTGSLSTPPKFSPGAVFEGGPKAILEPFEEIGQSVIKQELPAAESIASNAARRAPGIFSRLGRLIAPALRSLPELTSPGLGVFGLWMMNFEGTHTPNSTEEQASIPPWAQPLDWSNVSGRGETRVEHINNSHGALNLNKPFRVCSTVILLPSSMALGTAFRLAV